MTSPSRILFVAPSAYRLGGVATWLDYVCAGTRDRGWQSVVGLVSGRWHDVEGYCAEHGGLHPLVVIANPTGSREGRVRELARSLRDLAPSVVLSANIVDTCAAIARIRASGTFPDSYQPRLLMTLHGIQPDLFEDIERERDVLDGVACSNRLALALARRAGIAEDRLHYVPYGVPVPQIADRPPPHGRLRIAYVGRIEQWQKRVLDLPPICDELRHLDVDFELWIAGAGPDEAGLRDALADHTVAGRVHWLRQIPASEVAERVYSHVDVLLNPSLWETGPIVVWEAMAQGVAVVTSRYVGSGLEGALVDGENCRMFAIGDIRNAAVAIASLRDQTLMQKIARGGRELVQSRYSIGASVAAWDAALRVVLSQPPVQSKPSQPRHSPPSGRLDRLLGVRWGETVRRLLGVRFEHSEPGGEWPHSYGKRPIDDEAFWALASSLDSGGAVADVKP